MYRDKGTMVKGGAKGKKIEDTPASIATAYPTGADGAILWQWGKAPTEEIIRTLQALVGEVPYLGEAVSSVVMAALEIPDDEFPAENSVTLAKNPYDFHNDVTFAIPLDGRLQELQEGHQSAYPTKKRALGKDKEEERNFLPNDLFNCVDSVGYISGEAKRAHAGAGIIPPWPRGIALPVRMSGNTPRPWTPEPTEYVEWAVALHRFLVKQWGFGCSPYLTGKYAKDSAVAQPTNNVSLQVITPDPRLSDELRVTGSGALGGAFFLLMIPPDMPAEDYEQLYGICTSAEGQRLFYHGSRQAIVLGAPDAVNLTRAWQPAAPVMRRFWSPSPLGIFETRAIPDPSGAHRRWGAQEAIEMSLAHVWRDAIATQSGTDRTAPGTYSSREKQYWDLVDRVASPASGFCVLGARTVLRTNMTRYSHHRDASNILKGFSGLIEIDSDAMSTAAAAIGQSRHLGGGFLVPIDIPLGLLDEKGAPSWAR
jgi:CRISPR-associated protein Csb2